MLPTRVTNFKNGKMARNKYLLRKINFGKKGELAREISEQLIKKSGKSGFSKMIRQAIIAYYSNGKEFQQAKINKLLEERKQLIKKVNDISKEMIANEKDLNKLGYKLDHGY